MREPIQDRPDETDTRAHPPIDPADLEEGKRQGDLLCELFQQARAQSVSTFDQFLAQLRDLALPTDRVAGGLNLPSGLRIELIKAVAALMKTVIFTMDDEGDPPPGRRDAHTETIDVITSVLRYAEEKRFENRVRSVACTLGSDDDWEVYDRITSDLDVLEEFARRVGRKPSDAKIRAWLTKMVRALPLSPRTDPA